jgi:G6PDH family F420-dependent oxidoreductase
MRFGYILSSEEHPPERLVQLARRAERAGFELAMLSDHFHPWVARQGHSSFAWSVLGAIAGSTQRLRVGTGVTCPTMRMHPAVVAQAAATTARLFDGRFFLGVGSGENLNEHVVGTRWPEPLTRIEMLEEALEVIRKLFEGGCVTHRGKYFAVDEARLFTRPEAPPPIYVAASGALSARLAGRAGDGLIGLAPDVELIDEFASEGGEEKPRIGELCVCYARSEQAARRQAFESWPNTALPGRLFSELKTPELCEAALELAREEDVACDVVCGPDPDRIVRAAVEYRAAGYDSLCLHQIGPNQDEFLDFCEKTLLPELHARC